MVKELRVTNYVLENLAGDIKKTYFKNNEIKSYNNICKLIEKLDGNIEIKKDNLLSPCFVKRNNKFTVYISQSDYEKINEKYYENKLVYEIAQCLSGLFLVAGYKISEEIWEAVPENKNLDGIINGINERRISPETSHYFACALLIGQGQLPPLIDSLWLSIEVGAW